MASRTTYVTSLVVFVIAAFSVGLVAGVNIGRRDVPPEQEGKPVPGVEKPQPVENPGNGTGKAPTEYPQAPDFELVELESGETVTLKDFSGSHVALLVCTTT